MLIIAIDTGGTFTDLAAYDVDTGHVVYSKSLTTYGDLADGAFDCMTTAGVDLARAKLFKHGTTIVINTLLQRVGAKAALVATEGFRDILEMARGSRPDPFDLYYRRHPVLIPRDLRYEVPERTSGKGEPERVPARADVAVLADTLRRENVEAVAVSFLNSYVAPAHERQVAQWLAELLPGVFVTHGSELSREWYEYERTATVAANAYVGPQVSGYLHRMDARVKRGGFGGKFFLMGSNGGVLGVEHVLQAPIALVESGPVGGSIGAAAYADRLGIRNAIAFDMGGTTAKCALVQDGRFDVKSVYYVGGYTRGFPIRGAVIDIVEVGAGGGSIAWLDAQKRLYVGPRSAGSTPGPVAYGRGGTEPTVTDANLVLGRIDPGGFLNGAMQLDTAAAARALRERLCEPLGYTGPDGVQRMAEGIIAIASVTMAGAIKRITLEKGLDPREYTLFAFGGGGPLHAFQIARELHIPRVIIPPEPGNFSALGMLLAKLRLDESTTFVRPLDAATVAEAAGVFAAMRVRMTAALRADVPDAEIAFEQGAEMRYRGQVHSVRVPLDAEATPAEIRARFEKVYRARYGHADAKNPVEIVSLTLAGYGSMDRPALEALAANRKATGAPAVRHRPVWFAAAGGMVDTPLYARAELPTGFAGTGPALIEEYGSTTVIGPGDRFRVGELGEIDITLAPATGGP
ncbi:MAG: hydantoinase/oxoprolinase family protein [Burkholderiales bacterium]